MEFKEYSEGTAVYLDAFISGLVPCVVTRIDARKVEARVTKDYKGYRKGELVWHNHSTIFPRDRLVKRGIYLRINTQYAWKTKL